MTDMSYQSFDQMVTEIGNNTSVAERYASNFVAGGTPMNNITESKIFIFNGKLILKSRN